MTDFSELTTLKVGGPIRSLVEPATRDELIAATLDAWGAVDDWLILGGGSNLVVADEGFDGTVVRVATRGIQQVPVADRLHEPGVPAPEQRNVVRLRVEAGEPWDAVVAHAVAHGWTGIEALSGIPGSAGAAPVQNIGAYGQEVASALVAVDFLDYETGAVTRVEAGELALGYRTSALKQGRLGLVVSLELDLVDAGGLSAPVAYAQLADALGVRLGDRVPVAAARDAVLALRASKGMLLSDADPDSRSAGSFFTNPVVSENFARGLPEDMPRWPTAPERPDRVLPLGSPVLAQPSSGEFLVKLSAAWLIEHAGIHRGFAIPGSHAAISSKHTLAVVTSPGATAAEVAQLAAYVQTRVVNELGVLLQPEPVLVGVEL